MKANKKKMILWQDQQNWPIFREDNQEKKGKNTPTIKTKYLIHLDEMYTFLKRHKLLNWRNIKSVLT